MGGIEAKPVRTKRVWMFSDNRGGGGTEKVCGLDPAVEPHPLQGEACLQKQSLSQPLVSLRQDSISLLFKGACYCHQGL